MPKKSIANGSDTAVGVHGNGIPSSAPTHGKVPSSFPPYEPESNPGSIAPDGVEASAAVASACARAAGGDGFSTPRADDEATTTTASAKTKPPSTPLRTATENPRNLGTVSPLSSRARRPSR